MMPLMNKAVTLPQALAPGDQAISVTEVSVSIGSTPILHNISLELKAGEVVALLGPNGAGKSTLLSAIAGDETISSGQISIAGIPLADWSLGDLARRRAVLLQQNAVFFPFTVDQVVEMGRAPWARTERERDDDDAIFEAKSVTDIIRFGDRHVPSLSGGERARAAFARVLAQRTGVLMLDEPTAALDLRHQEDVLRIARERAAQGDAVIVVLHDLSLAAAYADRIVLMHRGRVVAAGTPDEVLTAARISEVYHHPVDVIRNPRDGLLVILPVREHARAEHSSATVLATDPEPPLSSTAEGHRS